MTVECDYNINHGNTLQCTQYEVPHSIDKGGILIVYHMTTAMATDVL
jgi:hypothetical protein